MLQYDKNFNKMTGGVHATILFLQVNYWFEKMKKPFFKFLTPPTNHLLYKVGDSWTEELGFSITELKTSMRKTGSKISSKQNGKLTELGLVLFWRGGNNLTFYQPNYPRMALLPEKQQDTLEKYFPTFRKWKVKVQKVGIPLSEITISTFREKDSCSPYIQENTHKNKTKNNAREKDPDLFFNHTKENPIVGKEKTSAKKEREIKYPFDSQNFKMTWESWKAYKLENFNFSYGDISEQAGLVLLADYDESFSTQLLKQAMNNGWRNFHFEETPQKFKNFIKPQNNERTNTTSNEKFEKHVTNFYQKHQTTT